MGIGKFIGLFFFFRRWIEMNQLLFLAVLFLLFLASLLSLSRACAFVKEFSVDAGCALVKEKV